MIGQTKNIYLNTMESKKTAKQNILIVAGETSGDKLGKSILEELKEKNQYAFFGTGGENLKAAGVEILYPLSKLSVVGIVEILFAYFRLKKIMNTLVKEAIKRKVKNAILIDFPGFNLRLAKKLSQHKISSYLVASPQIWAWRYKRIYKIKKYIKAVFCFYDFEEEIYQKEKISAYFVGHPLVKEWQKYQKKENPRLIAILPGSRPLEIKKLMPFFLELMENINQKFSQFHFKIPAANDTIFQMLQNYPLPKNAKLTKETASRVLSHAYAAFACSGTVTLECAYFQVPFFLVYKASYLSYWIALLLVKTSVIGLPNILAKKEIVKEFWQSEVNLKTAWPFVEKILVDKKYRQNLQKELKKVAVRLGDGQAAKKIALILEKNFTAQ